MPRSACPFCFTRIDTARLAYRCTGAGRSGCVQGRDPVRTEHTGSLDPTFPTFVPADGRFPDAAACPECHGPTRRRACPECHTALPLDFLGSSSPLIGLVGPKASGKTVLMTALVHGLRRQVAERFGADVAIVAENPDGLDGLSAYQRTREQALFVDGRLPAGTDTHRAVRRTPVVLRWRQEVARRWAVPGLRAPRRTATTTFSFIDTAGEDLGSTDSTFTLRYLHVVDQLVVVLDPFLLPGARAHADLPGDRADPGADAPVDVLRRVTELLRTRPGARRTGPLDVPVAVVLTKMDAFFGVLPRGDAVLRAPAAPGAYDEADGQAVHDEVVSLLERWSAGDVVTHMRLNYRRYRFFAVSALGAEPDYARAVADGAGVRPHRVEDPVLWLLSTTGGVPTA